jgi:hypothetical protein
MSLMLVRPTELLKIDMIGTPRLRLRAIVNFHKAAIGLYFTSCRSTCSFTLLLSQN